MDCQGKRMEEPTMETNHDNKLVDKQEEEEEEEEGVNSDSEPSVEANASKILAELNLIVILSFISLSAEECLSFQEIDKKESEKELEANSSMSRLQTRKRELNEFKVVDRRGRMPRFQTRIRDFRHCRRM